MDSLIQQLTDNPILLAVALILVTVGVYTLVKRLWKLRKPALFLLVLLAGYIGYLVKTEQELPEELQIQQLTDNPILLAVALILVAVGGYTLVKRLWKPALFLLVLLAGYIGYLVMTEQKLPEELQKGKEFIEEIAIFTYGFYDLGEETWKDMLEKFGLNEDEILWLFIPIFLIIFAIAYYVMQRKEEKEEENKKSRTKAVLDCMFLGFLGIHRFYLGYRLIGIIQFLTGGGFLIWMIVDFVRLITGSLRPVDYEEFDETFFGSEWMGTQLKQQLLDCKEYQDAVNAGDKAGAKASELSLKRQIEWWDLESNKQRLRSDKEYQGSVHSGDKDGAIERKIALKKEIVAEELREKGRECRDLGKPFCAWCMFPDHRMEFVEGEAGKYIWKYRNKDGSKDMRVNDNSKSAGYTSEWLCNECGANTTMKHYMRESPSKDAPVYKVTLKNNGSGNRIAEDWESDEVTFVHESEAHRKGDN
jgi:hypothetical protein